MKSERQAIALGKRISQSEAYQPHGTEIDHRRFPGIARSYTNTVGHDAGCKEWFSKSLDAQTDVLS